MPTYAYKRPSGKLEWLTMTISEMLKTGGKITLEDGTVAERCIAAEHAGVAHRPGNWPIYSEAAGVLPSQINEAKALAAQSGVKIDFTPDGRAIFTDKRQRRDYCRLVGLTDRSGGYGDP